MDNSNIYPTVGGGAHDLKKNVGTLSGSLINYLKTPELFFPKLSIENLLETLILTIVFYKGDPNFTTTSIIYLFIYLFLTKK